MLTLNSGKCAMGWDEFTAIIMAVFLWAGTTLALDGQILGLLMFLLVLDGITGFIKALVLKKATSQRLIFGIGKKMLIILVPITISAAAIISGNDVTVFISWVYSLLALGEAYSILANIIAINSKKEIEEFDALSVISNGILKILKNIGQK